MHDISNLGKRPREEHDHAENTKRRRGDDSASTGFGLGPAGRQHLRFAGTATIHFDFNINTESLSKESAQQQYETQQDKAHDQASSRKPCREVRLFGVNIADGLGRQQQEASSSRQAELDLEQRLGQQQGQESTLLAQEIDVYSVIRDFLVEFGPMPQGQESTILAQQTEVSQASSSRQPFGWRPEAFHLAQPHQEIGHFSQPEVINEQISLEIPSDSDNESSHARPFVIRETSRERIHHQTHDNGTASSAPRPDRSHGELEAIAEASKNREDGKTLPKEMRENIK